jgi:hypothetical protein
MTSRKLKRHNPPLLNEQREIKGGRIKICPKNS